MKKKLRKGDVKSGTLELTPEKITYLKKLGKRIAKSQQEFYRKNPAAGRYEF